MTKRILFIIFFFGLIATTSISAQETKQKSWNAEKIKGTRFIVYPPYGGTPYLNEKFILGEIELSDGTIIGNVGLRYSSYQDELIYYNADVATQIVIDRISLKGFSFTDAKGIKRVFRRQFYDIYLHEQRFFEVLSDGPVSLLSFRKVDLETCETSYSKYGLAYNPAYRYYFYSAEKGYSPIKITRNSLLSKFSKPDQKLVRKTLRKNDIQIIDEPSFIKAWNLIKESGIKINL